MYCLAQDVDRESLRKYGFRKGNEWNGAEKIIWHHEQDDYWLLPTWQDKTIQYADKYENDALWYIQIESSGRFWMYCTPFCCTHQINNDAMDQMFYILRNMILDGIIIDDYVEDAEDDSDKQGTTEE